MKFKKILGIFLHLFFWFLIALVAFWASYVFRLWTGYPIGWDSGGHVFRLLQVARFWPNIDWVHTWAGGMPLFLRYPVLPYLFMGAVKAILPLSAKLILTLTGISAVILGGVGVYLVVFELTKSKLLGFASGLVYVTTPAVWTLSFVAGAYARGMSAPFAVLSLWAILRLFHSSPGTFQKRLNFFLTTLFISLAVLCHFLVGVATIGLIFFVWFIARFSGKTNIKEIFLLMFISFALSSWFLIPFLADRPINVPMPDYWEVTKADPVRWDEFFFFHRQRPYTATFVTSARALSVLTPFLFPLTLILLPFSLLAVKKTGERVKKRLWFFWTLLLLSGFGLAYGRIWIPIPLIYQYLGRRPTSVVLLAIVLSIAGGFSLYLVFSKSRFFKAIIVFLIILILGWFHWQTGLCVAPKAPSNCGELAIIPSSTNPTLEALIEEFPSEQFNFRFGTDDNGALGAGFNVHRPYTPQTRDFYFHGIVNDDYYVYAYVAIWKFEDNLKEALFNLDWWGVKKFILTRKFNMAGKFVDQESILLKKNMYNYLDASPILLATNTPSILVIGDDIAHNFVLKSLAYANLNSRHFLPVNGEEFIDDYKLKELEKFDSIFLYNYKVRNLSKATGLLEEYVRGGGGLVIESRKEDPILGDIFPIEELEFTDFGKGWQLTKESDSRLIEGIDLSAFGPAVFDEGPWGVAVAARARDWAEIILKEAGKPILVKGNLGDGRIVWSGLNLPYHTITYANAEESRFMGKILNWVSDSETYIAPTYPQENDQLVYETEDFKAEFINPEKRVVTLKKEAKGVLLKEFYFPNWKAYVNGKREKIYKVGPAFMYVPLLDSKTQDEVVFVFGTRPIQWLSRILSITTLLGLIYYLGGWSEKIKTKLPSPITSLRQWWEKEDEE